MDNNASENRFDTETGVIPTLSPLSIEIDDKRLLTYINYLEKESESHWNAPAPGGLNIKERRKQNLKYRFGRQLIGRDLKKWESEFVDNIIMESEEMLKALAVSKMPDIIVSAGGVSDDSERQLTAELLSKWFDKYINSEKQRRDLGMMFKHLPVYFIAAKKYRWNQTKDKMGDYDEEVVNPEQLLLDHTAITSNPDDMLYIIHYVEKTAKEWAMLFPDKEEEIKKYVAGKHPAVASEAEESKIDDVLMAQKVKVAECWYDWFDKAEDFDKENPKFEFYSGVAWKLSKTVLLGKSKNPNWDYEGHNVPTLNDQPVSPDVMEQILSEQAMTGQAPQGLQMRQVFNNYFKFPKKPFILMSYDQFLRSALDETSRIEQQIPIQKSMDDVERQTDHMVKNHKGKHIWSQDSGMTKKDLKKVDMDNPNIDLVVKGDLSKVHAYMQPEMPPAEMFVHIRDRRTRIFDKASVHGATRGEITTSVATTNQISREADFTKNDDVVNETILHVVTESVKARLHIMKLRYSLEHFQQVAGIEEGKYLHLRLTNDSIDDGMEVIVKASTTDKLRAERNAQTMAQIGFTDPYYFMKDLNIPNAEERAEAIFLYNTNPALWYEKVVKGKDISALADQVTQSVNPVQTPVEGGAPVAQAPVQPSPADTSNVATVPQGSPSILQKAMGGVKNLLRL